MIKNKRMHEILRIIDDYNCTLSTKEITESWVLIFQDDIVTEADLNEGIANNLNKIRASISTYNRYGYLFIEKRNGRGTVKLTKRGRWKLKKLQRKFGSSRSQILT
jgi:hypothetical protein